MGPEMSLDLQKPPAQNTKQSGQSRRLAVIIPVFNEEVAIGATLDSMVTHGITGSADIVVVDDGSTDGTADIVKKYPVTLLHHPSNKGYGASLKTGIRHTAAEDIIIMDSDGQHSAVDIEQIRGALRYYPMVIGERADKDQVQSRKFGKWIIRKVGEFLVEQKLPDFNSGFRGFHRRNIMSLLHLMPNGFSFSTTSTLAFLKLGHPIGTVPIHVMPRVGRKSTVRPGRDGAKTLMLLLRIIMLFNPLKLFIPASVVFGTWGFVLGCANMWLTQRVSNGAQILMVFSMFLFFFGLLADQVSMLNLREEDNARD
jgi:glycosyltransferase involved in cell wall biosynthesis